MKKVYQTIGLLCMTTFMTGACVEREEVTPDSYIQEENFIITDSTRYIEDRFAITEAVYNYDDVLYLTDTVEEKMEGVAKNALPEEVKELSYHLFQNSPTYLGTHRENVRNYIALLYINQYIHEQKELGTRWTLLKIAMSDMMELYNHIYKGSDLGQRDIEDIQDNISDIYTQLVEKKFYEYREDVQ